MKIKIEETEKTITKKIKKWLYEDKLRNWIQGYKNLNCFTSNLGEALYVYDDKIKFWEDIRCSEFSEYNIPQNKIELYFGALKNAYNYYIITNKNMESNN